MTIIGKIHWDEGPLSASTSASGEINYFLHSDDPANDGREDALAWLDDNAPTWLFGLLRDSIEIEERLADSPTEAIWEGLAKYKDPGQRKPKPLEEDPNSEKQDARLSIRSGSAGSLTMLRSKKLLQELYAGQGSNTPWRWAGDPNIETLLNVEADADGESAAMFVAKGISVPVSTVEIVLESVQPFQAITVDGFLVEACLQVNKVNEAIFYGFPIASLRLMNVDAKQRVGEPGQEDTLENQAAWEVTYTFSFSPEVPADEIDVPEEIGGQFTRPKRGWDYIDTLYVTEPYSIGIPPDDAKFSLPQCKRITMHQIYDEADFADKLRVRG